MTFFIKAINNVAISFQVGFVIILVEKLAL